MKKIGFLTFFLTIAATVVLTLAFSAAVLQPKAAAAPVPAAAPAPTAVAATPERHPHIDEALDHMRAGLHELEVAENDFGGHKAKSIEHLRQAIKESEICLTMK